MRQPITSDVVEEKQILRLCRETVGSRGFFAACFYGPRVYGYADEKTNVNLLLIIPHFPPKISNFAKKINSIKLSILAIDKQTFETDVEQGKFGELAAEIMTLPYEPWINPHYLEQKEVRIKKRFVLELLRNIILQYPELSVELLIEPEYFMYEIMRRSMKLFPSLIHSYIKLLNGKSKKQNIASMMKGYTRALKELEEENCVAWSNSHIKVNKDFIETTKDQRTPFSNILTSIQKAVLPYLRGISSRTSALLQDQVFVKTPYQKAATDLLEQLEETERHLLMPTPLGPVPLSEKTDIQDFVRKTVPGGEALKITIEGLGGVLNSVFLLRLQKDHKTQKIVVKRFEDWLGFKWFPLALWTLGTQSFAVLGEARLEREYSINQFMRKHGFSVPRILYVSLKKRLIFEEFIEGEKVNKVVRRIITSQLREKGKDEETIRLIGKEIARAHSLGVVLGDCKPENIVITNERKVCFLDLEQAIRNGNQPWDIVEFLYYSGHYFLPIHSDRAARTIASSFIEGYLEAGGKRENVRRAASARYTKVFSVFTLPHIILIMANICKKMGEEKAYE